MKDKITTLYLTGIFLALKKRKNRKKEKSRISGILKYNTRNLLKRVNTK